MVTISLPGVVREMSSSSQEAARARELGKTAFLMGDFRKATRHYEEAVGWQLDEVGNWSCLAEVMMETQAYREVRTGCSDVYMWYSAVCSTVGSTYSVQFST